MSTPTIIVAAPYTGSGKTTTVLGMIRAFARKGLKVGSFKVGPDYIDPAFHERASGLPCRNVDSWAMRFETVAALVDEAGRDCDIVIGEGVMGLFDGAPDGSGSTADLAALFGLPVMLVVDARRMAQSVAALLDGYLRFREDVEIAAILLNRVSSESHARLLIDACEERFSTPVVGWLRHLPALEVPHRHLGLVQAGEHPQMETMLDTAGQLIEDYVDLDRLQRQARIPNVSSIGPTARPLPVIGQRIAVARDIAFAFAYPATLEGWRRQGAEIVPFSPLADEPPDGDADAVYLPGGYPELHAGRLAGNRRFIEGLHAAGHRDAFVYGECGGYMVLGERLIDRDGESHAMAGLLPVTTSFEKPRLHLGYRELTLLERTPLGRPPLRYRGHEFHYASERARRGPGLFRVKDARGRDQGESGCHAGTIAGSFHHLIDRTPHLALVR